MNVQEEYLLVSSTQGTQRHLHVFHSQLQQHIAELWVCAISIDVLKSEINQQQSMFDLVSKSGTIYSTYPCDLVSKSGTNHSTFPCDLVSKSGTNHSTYPCDVIKHAIGNIPSMC